MVRTSFFDATTSGNQNGKDVLYNNGKGKVDDMTHEMEVSCRPSTSAVVHPGKVPVIPIE